MISFLGAMIWIFYKPGKYFLTKLRYTNKKEGEIISEVPSFGCRLRRVKFI